MARRSCRSRSNSPVSSCAPRRAAAAGAVWMPKPPCPANQKKPSRADRSHRPAGDRARSCAGPPTCARPPRPASRPPARSRSIARATSSSSARRRRGARRLVVRAEPELAVLGLEIEAAADVEHQRQVGRGRDRCATARPCAAAVSMPSGTCPGQLRDRIGPGAGRVDHKPLRASCAPAELSASPPPSRSDDFERDRSAAAARPAASRRARDNAGAGGDVDVAQAAR
jgi:hypothetical protein